MNVLSHALLPALIAAPLLPRTTPRDFHVSAGLVALAGALPDVLHPHLSLAARYASWSHTVVALAGWSVAFLALAAWPRLRPWRRALAFGPFAYAAHLALDGVSGGIAWLYPFSREVISHRLIRYAYWFPVDALLALTACVTVLWLRHRYWSGNGAVGPAQPPAIEDSR